jgi:hypothetical protein
MPAREYLSFTSPLSRDQMTRGNGLAFLDRRFPGSKCGSVYLYHPSRIPFSGGKLDVFHKVLSMGFRYAFEFRDPDWFRRETCDILSQHEIAFRIHGRGRDLQASPCGQGEVVNDDMKLSVKPALESNPEAPH